MKNFTSPGHQFPTALPKTGKIFDFFPTSPQVFPALNSYAINLPKYLNQFLNFQALRSSGKQRPSR